MIDSILLEFPRCSMLVSYGTWDWVRCVPRTMIPVTDSVNFRQEPAGKPPLSSEKLRKMVGRWLHPVAGFLRLWFVQVWTRRIPPSGMITVLLLPLSYHLPEFYRRVHPVHFHLGVYYRTLVMWSFPDFNKINSN